MKVSCFIIILLSSALCAFAQNPFEVTEYKWRYILRNPALDENPFRAINEQRQLLQARADTISQNKIRAKTGREQEYPPTQVNARVNLRQLSLPDSTTYKYELSVKNTNQKDIKLIEWDYVFFDTGSKTEIGRKRFVENLTIGSGKTRKIAKESTAPPTGVVNVAVLNKNLKDQYIEKIIIKRIVYKDGSVWNAPSN